jgi:putative redox protein
MDCTVSWLGQEGGMAFVAETATGHLVTMDAAADVGGRNLAPRPMEMLLAGTGGCAAIDVVTILKKSNQAVIGCKVQLHAERAEKDPKVFTQIRLHFVVTGHQINPNMVESAIKLSHQKYCSASAMLGKTAELVFSHEIIEQ